MILLSLRGVCAFAVRFAANLFIRTDCLDIAVLIYIKLCIFHAALMRHAA